MKKIMEYMVCVRNIKHPNGVIAINLFDSETSLQYDPF